MKLVNENILVAVAVAMLAVVAACPATGAVILTKADFQGPGSWDTDDAGLAGWEVTLEILAEDTPHVNLNVFYWDKQQDGWSAGGNVLGSATNDTVVFSAADGVGDAVTGIIVGSDWNLSLLNDLNGNSLLSFNDAYLNSESDENYTPGYDHQYIKYYDANPGLEYEFDGIALGDGHDVLIFIDDDHSAPNCDYDDMIIGATITGIPEPGTMAMLAIGVIGLLRRRRQ